MEIEDQNEALLEIILGKMDEKDRKYLGDYVRKAIRTPKYFSKIMRKTLLNGERSLQEVNKILQDVPFMANILYDSVIREAKLLRNPPVYSVMKDKTGYFTIEQINRIMKACENERDALLVTLYTETNVRNSELLELKPRFIDHNLQKIWLPIRKKRSKDAGDMFKISYRTYTWLCDYVKRNSIGPDRYVFESAWKPGHPISMRSVRYIVEKVCKKAGITEVGMKKKKPHPHHFRHTYASIRLRQLSQKIGPLAAINQLKEEMHHSSVDVTYQYIHFLESDKTDEEIRFWEYSDPTKHIIKKEK